MTQANHRPGCQRSSDRVPNTRNRVCMDMRPTPQAHTASLPSHRLKVGFSDSANWSRTASQPRAHRAGSCSSVSGCAAAAGDESSLGERRPTGRLAQRLIAQVQADAHLIVGHVVQGRVDGALGHQQHAARSHRQRHRWPRRDDLVWNSHRVTRRTVRLEAVAMTARDHLQAAVLDRRRIEWHPHRQDRRLVSLGQNDAVVLMPRDPGDQAIRAAAAIGRGHGAFWQLHADVLDRVRVDLGPTSCSTRSSRRGLESRLNTAGPTWIGVSCCTPDCGRLKSKCCGKLRPLS